MKPHPSGRTLATILFALAVAGALGYAGWQYVRQRERALCPACAREIHQHSRTVAVVEGKTIVYCCPSCAFWDHRQSGRPVGIVELTDQLSGGPLKPSQAFAVVASDVNPCLPHSPAVSEDSQPMHVSFDRCRPSILAFATKEDAAEFASLHGGRVLPFASLSAEYR